jgi:hypothetical protein
VSYGATNQVSLGHVAALFEEEPNASGWLGRFGHIDEWHVVLCLSLALQRGKNAGSN